MQKAHWWNKLENGSIRCELCPRHCCIPEGGCGYCAVRMNQNGELFSLSYGHPVATAIDPIEKKPLNEFMPGTRTFSFGTFGCNLGCVFCQNDSLSRGHYTSDDAIISPEQVVRAASHHQCPSLSYTYNEPTVFAEYAIDCARLAHQAGLANILVSNGYICDQASDELYPLLDAANIDLKGFSEAYYQEMCKGALPPILASLEKLKRLGVHLEITTLVVPGKNDDEPSLTALFDWVGDHLGKNTPLHFSAYHPAYLCTIPATRPVTLYKIQNMAAKLGFNHIYLGNIG